MCPGFSGTYPPEQVLLGGRVEDVGDLQVGVHAEPVFGGAGGGGAVGFVPLGSGLLVSIVCWLRTDNITDWQLTSPTVDSSVQIHGDVGKTLVLTPQNHCRGRKRDMGLLTNKQFEQFLMQDQGQEN